MDTPPARPDTPTSQERIRHAQMMGTVSGLKGVVANDPDRYTELSTTWPQLAERIDRLMELIDWR